MLQMETVTASVSSAAAAAADDDDGADEDYTAQRLTVVADDDEDHGVVEGAVGGEPVDPFGIEIDPRSALHEVLHHNALFLSTLL